MTTQNTAIATAPKTVAAQVDLQAELARLKAENQALKDKEAKASAPKKISFKVSDKGGCSVYGLGRFPVTLYASQWDRLLSDEVNTELRAFIEANRSKFTVKADTPAV